MKRIVFEAKGIPRPAGSKKYVGINKKTGRALLVDASGKKGADWRKVVAAEAKKHFSNTLAGPIAITIFFRMPFRKTDLKKDGTVKPTAPYYHTSKPDSTKLLRAVEDSLTGIAWKDDAQIADQCVKKIYSLTPGIYMEIEQLNDKR